nr:hypothetical protein [Tanacetum cinerariifolium]
MTLVPHMSWSWNLWHGDLLLYHEGKMSILKGRKSVPGINSHEKGKWKEKTTREQQTYYKIIRADGSHQLFLSFLSLLRNFDREDVEILWQIVKERFASSKPKSFLDDFLLTILKAMFEKPNVDDQRWKNQRGIHGLAKVKSCRLLESCGVHIITFITTHIILLVERRYPLKRFTLEQMLNNVRLEVKEESEVSLELLRFTSKIYTKGLLLLVEDLLLLVQVDVVG